MKNKQEWFEKRVKRVSRPVMKEMTLSAEIIARIDEILKEKKMI